MIRKPHPETPLDKALDRVLTKMEGLEPDSDEYAKLVAQLVKLHALKVTEYPKRISTDTLATIIANLVGIVLILNHERASIVTSRAVNFVQKLH